MHLPRTSHPDGPGTFYRGHGIGRMFGMGPFGDHGLGRLAIVFLFFLLIAGVAWVISRLAAHGPTHHHNHGPVPPTTSGTGPIDVLRMRFAQGEIDEDEFTRRLRLLQGNHVSN